jgi:sulfatase modifying factor 1
MVAIPGGAFTMGSSGEFSRADEQPPHHVRVDSVWMDTTEVTNAAFRRFAEATGYVTTAEKAPNLEEIMAQLPKGSVAHGCFDDTYSARSQAVRSVAHPS